MICRECAHAVLGTTKGDDAMGKMGYRSCAAAVTAIERATYFKGDSPCRWEERSKAITKSPVRM